MLQTRHLLCKILEGNHCPEIEQIGKTANLLQLSVDYYKHIRTVHVHIFM